jgi:hypothetical protein
LRLTVQLSFFPLLLFPLLVEGFLIRGQKGVYLLVRVLVDLAAGAAVLAAIGIASGGIGALADAVEGDVAVNKDHLHLSDLVFAEI